MLHLCLDTSLIQSDGRNCTVCVSCVLYMEHAASQQLFLCYGDGDLGKPFSKQRLTHWLCGGISHAYELADLDPWSHLSTLHPSLEVLFSKASVAYLFKVAWVFSLPFDPLTLFEYVWIILRAVLKSHTFRIYFASLLIELLKYTLMVRWVHTLQYVLLCPSNFPIQR